MTRNRVCTYQRCIVCDRNICRTVDDLRAELAEYRDHLQGGDAVAKMREERDAAIKRAAALAEALKPDRLAAGIKQAIWDAGLEFPRHEETEACIAQYLTAALSTPPAPTLGERLVRLVESGGMVWLGGRDHFGASTGGPHGSRCVPSLIGFYDTLESAVAAAEAAEGANDGGD